MQQSANLSTAETRDTAVEPIPTTDTPGNAGAEPDRGAGIRGIGPLATLLVLAAALFVLRGELRGLRYVDLVAAARGIPPSRIIAAVLLTGASYLTLTGYDALALRYIGRSLGPRRTIVGSFVSYALSQTLGFPLITGGSVRFRLWSLWGLSTAEIAEAVAFVGATFAVGVAATFGVALVIEHSSRVALLGIPLDALWPVGVVCLAAVLAYLAWTWARAGRSLRVGSWQFTVPSLRLAIAQVVVAFLDWSLVGTVLYVLLPPGHGLTLTGLLGAFVIAQVVGVASHVPGGIGVFETMMLVVLAPRFSTAPALGSLLAFRVIYYLVPFAAGLATLAWYEIARQRERITVAGRAAGQIAGTIATRWAPTVLPYVLSATTFAGGCILLVSGATPPIRSRVAALAGALPLGIIELSHFAGSLAGIGLVVLARAIYRRLDAAYVLTVALLVVGIVASLLKGLDWEEALVLGVVLSAVLPSRRVFYRRAALTGDLFSPAWTAAILAVVGGTIWLGFFAHQHEAFRTEMWWQFTERGDASRFLRATVGVLAALLGLAMFRLLRPARPAPELPAPAELDRARAIAVTARDTSAYLALLGDKSLLFSESGNAFVMYGVAGKSWVALGDPVGSPEEHAEVAWRLREEADLHGGWTVFYEVSAASLPLYVDLGLTLLKLGEQAVIPLSDFSLEGGQRRHLRRTHREVTRAGVAFEVVPPERVPSLIPELRAVSDAWLATKRTREKGFSLGRFDEDYLKHFPVAIARRNGRLVAFANLWLGAPGEEVSADLMRFSPDAPPGVMDYLFLEIMLWGRGQGFARFNLGMAPLSGFADRALAPLWHRLGAFLFRHGEHFYNFQGIRHYKAKFSPVWIPRYLASPGGLVLPRVLINVASLISGGVRGIVTR